MPASVLVDLDFVISEAAFLVGKRAVDQLFELFDAERLELKDLGPRDERTVDVKERIVRRRADESEISTFDVGQKNVLLCFVEMMDLVDEQNCFLSGSLKSIGRSGDDPPH